MRAITASANAYAATEANAAQTLVNAINAPAEKLLGQPLIGGTAATAAGSALPNALGRIGDLFLGTNGSSALRLPPTGTGGLAVARALLAPAAAASPAAVIPVSVGTAIENLYLAVEPWVAYGFNLAAWAAGWLPWVGILAPQINFFYYLFEPMVQSVLFNTIDWLDGTVTFSQGLSNIWAATTASVNQFINTEISWIRSFFPPLPPLPPLP